MSGSSCDTSTGMMVPFDNRWLGFGSATEAGFGLDGYHAGATSTGFATSKVKQSLVYVWDPGTDDYGEPLTTPAPAKVYFRLFGEAEASTSAHAQGTNAAALLAGAFSSSGTADDGLGDQAVVSGPSSVEWNGGWNAAVSRRSKSSGTHLVQKDGSSGTITFTFNVSAHADGSLTIPSPTTSNQAPPTMDGGGGTEAWPVTVTEDSRGVTLHRDGAHGETVDADGTTHGDTIYSYLADYLPRTEEGFPSTEDHKNWQVFHPYLTGSWSQRPMINLEAGPNINWQWSPNESEDTWSMGKVSMHYRTFRTFNDAPQHQDTSEERDITYTATDNQDGATATATYILTVHDPYEKYIDNPPAPSRENIQRRGSISFTATPAALTGTSYFEQADSWGASISAAGPLDKWIADILGFRLDLSYSFTVNQGASVNLGPYQPGYGSWAETYDEYTTYTGTAKIYDAGGYCGTHDYYVKVPTGTGIQAHSPEQDMGPVK